MRRRVWRRLVLLVVPVTGRKPSPTWTIGNLSLQICPGFPQHNQWLLSHLSWLRGKHIMFLGDSRTRYQYINLAWHLLHRSPPPFDLSEFSRELKAKMRADDAPVREGEPYPYSKRFNEFRPGAPDDLAYQIRWGEYYWASSQLLTSERGHEVCDCFRGLKNTTDGQPRSQAFYFTRNNSNGTRINSWLLEIENRYIRSPQLDVALTYSSWLDDSVPFQGHWHPTMSELPDRLQCVAGACDSPPIWRVWNNATKPDPLTTLLREYILELKPPVTHLVLGSRWPHIGVTDSRAKSFMREFAEVLRERSASGAPVPELIWKSDIYQVVAPRGKYLRAPDGNPGRLMQIAAAHNWTVVNQTNLTRHYSFFCYNDKIHLNEVGNTQLNELLLRTLRDSEHAKRQPSY